MPSAQRTWIELSRSALRQNVTTLCRLIGPKRGLIVMVKANAYGHGINQMLKALKGLPVWGLGVAHGEEALEIRRLGYRGKLVVLSSWRADELPALTTGKVELVVWDKLSAEHVTHLHKKPNVHLKLDSGTSRIGFRPEDLPWLHEWQQNYPGRISGIFSHVANAEEKSPVRTSQQIKHFTTLVHSLAPKRGIKLHSSCTAMILRYPEAHFDLSRAGIGVYGLYPSAEIEAWIRANKPNIHLRPVLAWYTRIIQIKSVPAGTQVGYGFTWRAPKPSRIAVLPVGYADGLFRAASNRGTMVISGQRAPIVGRISMNLCMLDVTGLRASVHDRVTIIGPGAPAEALAQASGTIHYEQVARINPSISRQLL